MMIMLAKLTLFLTSRFSLAGLFPACQIRRLLRNGLVAVITVVLFSACAGGTGKRTTQTSKAAQLSDKALIHAQLAKGYLQQKQYAVAKEELEEALRIDPSHSDSNYVMALLMMELKQYDVAETHFMRAVRGNRENASAAHDFGMFLCQIGKQRESVEYFEIAASNPLFAKPELSYMRAGECLSQLDDPIAVDYLKRALQTNPRLRPALYRLALINYEKGSYFPARAYIERFLAITNPQPPALLLAYKIELKLNAPEVADKYRVKLLEGFPGSEQASKLRRQTNNR